MEANCNKLRYSMGCQKGRMVMNKWKWIKQGVVGVVEGGW